MKINLIVLLGLVSLNVNSAWYDNVVHKNTFNNFKNEVQSDYVKASDLASELSTITISSDKITVCAGAKCTFAPKLDGYVAMQTDVYLDSTDLIGNTWERVGNTFNASIDAYNGSEYCPMNEDFTAIDTSKKSAHLSGVKSEIKEIVNSIGEYFAAVGNFKSDADKQAVKNKISVDTVNITLTCKSISGIETVMPAVVAEEDADVSGADSIYHPVIVSAFNKGRNFNNQNTYHKVLEPKIMMIIKDSWTKGTN
jgi:hypothetical protein